MGNRNASSSAFGWDFQANAAIVLMLENIQNAEKIRVEGKTEDIEITLMDKTKIYSQAKSVMKLDDYSNVITKLEDALETLNEASRLGDGSLYTYITNSPNPFNNQRIMGYFTSKTHLDFDELPESARKKIKKILNDNSYTDLDTTKFDIRVIPFYGKDTNNRYKEIKEVVNAFLSELKIYYEGLSSDIMKIWQRDFFQNATLPDTEIAIEKNEMMWPLIVLVVDRVVANDYKKEFDDDEIEEIERKYKLIINQQTLLYEFVAKVITDYRKYGKSIKAFVNDCWGDYLDRLTDINTENYVKEVLMKIILYRILTQRNCINEIKKGVNL